jgi:hypothetical protein
MGKNRDANENHHKSDKNVYRISDEKNIHLRSGLIDKSEK